jgi:hypothetical protein
MMTSDKTDLIQSVRRGDLVRVRYENILNFSLNKKVQIFIFSYLVEQKEVELNIRDKWDSTPL